MDKYLWVLVGIMIFWLTSIANEYTKPSLLDKAKVIYYNSFDHIILK